MPWFTPGFIGSRAFWREVGIGGVYAVILAGVIASIGWLLGWFA